MTKTLFVIMDGVADIGKRTALSKANKPNLDMLAQHSFCGLWKAKLPEGYNIASFSDIATLQLLGCYDYPGRGYLEALGIGLKPKKGSICFRVNFATAKKIASRFSIIDRRAGRDENGLDALAKAVNKIKLTDVKGVKVKFYRSVGHRGVLVLEGKNLAPIADIDTGKPSRLTMPIGRTANEKRTALALTELMNKAYDLLDKHTVNSKSPHDFHNTSSKIAKANSKISRCEISYHKRKKKANFILLRGAGSVMKVRSFRQRFGLRGAVISGVGITKGIARFLGMGVIDVMGATGHFHTNLHGKIDAALNAFNVNSKQLRSSYDNSKPFYGSYDMVVLHVNGADEAGHDRNFAMKKKYIEMVDQAVFSKIIKRKELNVVVAGDHITSCKTGQHMAGPVPFLIYDANDGNNCIKRFDEYNCKKGFRTKNPMEKILLTMRK